MRDLSISYGAYLGRYGTTVGIKKMIEDGFKFIDYNPMGNENYFGYNLTDDEIKETFTKERELLNAAGITVNQTHGPWRWPAKDLEWHDRAEWLKKTEQAIKMTKYLGAKYMAMHVLLPHHDRPINKNFQLEINYEFVNKLAQIGQENNVVVCMENLPFLNTPLNDPKDLYKFIKEINNPYIKMCFDTGHAATVKYIQKDVGNAIRLCGDEIRIFHVHDNDGNGDHHWLPLDIGIIDWADFKKALNDINFNTVISFETEPKELPEPYKRTALKNFYKEMLYFVD